MTPPLHSEPVPGVHPPRACRRWLPPGADLWLLVAIGLLLRLKAWSQMPVVGDEVTVMAHGYARSVLQGNAQGWLMETPISVSNGVTPLWFWIQALPAWIFGETSKLGLRLLPLLLGLWSIVLAYRLGLRLGGRRTAWFAGLLLAAMGLVVYTNSRGEFSESLFVPLLLLLMGSFVQQSPERTIPWHTALLPAVMLLTYFGKGLVVWLGYSAALLALYGLGRLGRNTTRRLEARRMAGLVLLPVVPSIAWLFAVQLRLFGDSQGRWSDIGGLASVFEALRKLTLGYGSEIKEFMVGPWYDALYVYTDFAIWPVLCLLVPWLLASWFCAARTLARGLHRGFESMPPGATEHALVFLLLTVPCAALFVAKGTLGARFHLLYLVIAVPWMAATLDRWLGAFEERRTLFAWAFGALVVVWGAWCVAWEDRLQGVFHPGTWGLGTLVGLGLLALCVAAARKPSWNRFVVHGVFSALSVGLVGVVWNHGVLEWGRRFAWEPEPRAGQLPKRVDELPNADALLAYSLLTRAIAEVDFREGLGARGGKLAREARPAMVQRIRPYLLRCLERHPDDRISLLFVGQELYGADPGEGELVRTACEVFLAKHPDDADVQRLLEKVR